MFHHLCNTNHSYHWQCQLLIHWHNFQLLSEMSSISLSHYAWIATWQRKGGWLIVAVASLIVEVAAAAAAAVVVVAAEMCYQSLEFVAETRILAEMKMENCGKNQAYFFSMKIKMMDLWMQIEDTTLIFIMILVCYISSNLPPECLKLHRF